MVPFFAFPFGAASESCGRDAGTVDESWASAGAGLAVEGAPARSGKTTAGDAAALAASLIRLLVCTAELNRRFPDPGCEEIGTTGGLTTDAVDRGAWTNRPRVGADGEDEYSGACEAGGVEELEESDSKERAAWAAGTGTLLLDILCAIHLTDIFTRSSAGYATPIEWGLKRSNYGEMTIEFTRESGAVCTVAVAVKTSTLFSAKSCQIRARRAEQKLR